MTELEDMPEAILFIDEIHTVIGAGATPGVRWTPRPAETGLQSGACGAWARRPIRSFASILKKTGTGAPVPEN